MEELHLAARPHVITIDAIPDSAGDAFVAVNLDVDDISHLQYTSGSTRPPVGVEITHRAVGTNLVQMILSIDLLDRNTHGVSWLPLYHDMGLSMIGFPAVYGGHSTLMSPTAFIRRPQRWIHALSNESRHGRVVTAAPNFAYEYTAQRGLPAPGDDVDLSHVVLIIGSEPVSRQSIETFNAAFAPYGLPPTAIQTVIWHRRGDLVRLHHCTERPTDSRSSGSQATGEWPDRACRGRRPRRCRARIVRSDSSQSVGRHRRPRHRNRAPRRASRRNLVVRQQYWSRILGSPRGNPAHVRRHPPLNSCREQPRSRLTGWRNMATDGRYGGVPRRRAVCHRPTCRSGRHRRSSSLPAGYRGHRGAGLADHPTGVRRCVFRADERLRRRRAPGDHRRTRFRDPPSRSGYRPSTQFARRCRTAMAFPLPMSASLRRARSRARRAASWLVGHAVRCIYGAGSATDRPAMQLGSSE